MRFTLVDRILELEPGRRIRAEVAFDPDEELFADHFPGRPLVPGSLLIEAMAQAGGWLALATDDFARWPLLVLVERAKFREPAAPGLAVELSADLDRSLGGGRLGPTVRVEAAARVGDRKIAQATCVYRLFEPSELAPGDGGEELRAWARAGYGALRVAGGGEPESEGPGGAP